jgi:hypothetical protein
MDIITNCIIKSQLSEMLNYQTVAAVADVFTIDLANRPIKNVRMTTADATAKTVALANVPATGDCEIFIELTYTNAAAITWFANILWLSGSAPTFIAGKVYRLAFFKVGTNWHGNCVGGW